MIFDLIGTHYTKTGVMLKDGLGGEYPEMVAVSGYHVNVIDANADEMTLIAPYIIQATTPSRTFAGRNDTVCLKFKDRAEWVSLGFEREAML